MTSVQLLKNCLLRQNAVYYTRRNYQLTMNNGKPSNSEQLKLKSVEDIPGPEKLPIVGNVLDYLKHEKKQHLWFQELQQKYGDIIKLDMGSFVGNLVYLFNPEYTKAMCAADDSMPDNFGFDTFVWYRNMRKKEHYPNGNAGIMGSYLPIWREIRSAANPVMMRKNTALDYVEDLNEIASQCIDRIAEKRDANNEIVNGIPDVVYLWALEGITKIFLDTRLGCLEQEIDPKCLEWVANAKLVAEGITEMQRNLPLWKYMDVPHYTKFDKASDFIYHESAILIHEAIKRLKETKDNGDKNKDSMSMIAKLADTFGEDSYVPIIMANDAILAGMDATTTTASFLLYNLANNPLKQEKAIEEIDKVVGDGKITAEKFEQLRYLKACFSESIRMTPATNGTARRLSQDVVIGEYLIPKGTCVIQIGFVNANNPRDFPEPHRYMPERWLRGHSDHHDAHPFAFLPFGFGPRICIGKRIAETEVVLLAAKMLQRFRMEYHHEPVGFSFASVNHPDKDMRIKLIKRV